MVNPVMEAVGIVFGLSDFSVIYKGFVNPV